MRPANPHALHRQGDHRTGDQQQIEGKGLLTVASLHLPKAHVASPQQRLQALATGIEAGQQRVVGLGLIHQRHPFIGL